MATSADFDKYPLPDDSGYGVSSVRYVPPDDGGGAGGGASGPMRIEETPSERKQRKKSAPQQSLNSCNMCIRYILVVSNCIFFLLGCTVIGLGIYVVVDKVNLISGLFGIPLIAPASYLIIAAGCIMFIISFIGCFGALFESKSVLILYSTALGLVLLLSCLGFILAIVFRTKVNDKIRTYMRSTLEKQYGVNLDNDWNRMVTEAWNGAQWKWYCCGVDDSGYAIYKGSAWYSIQSASTDILKPLVPETCCVRNQYKKYINKEKCQTWPSGPPTISSDERNDALEYRGCFEAGRRVLNEVAGYLIGIGVVLAILVIGGLCLAIMLAMHV